MTRRFVAVVAVSATAILSVPTTSARARATHPIPVAALADGRWGDR